MKLAAIYVAKYIYLTAKDFSNSNTNMYHSQRLSVRYKINTLRREKSNPLHTFW